MSDTSTTDRMAAARAQAPRRGTNEPIDSSEDAIALGFAEKHAGAFVHDHTSGLWHVWGNGRWAPDGLSIVANAARDFTRLARARVDDNAAVHKMGKIAFGSAVERASRADPRLAVSHEIWDRDPWLLGVPGAMVSLRDGEMREATPDLYISRSTSVAPAPAGTPCPIWIAFLQDATNNDAELQAFLQRLCGYFLTGDVTEEVLTFIYGEGGNGKGVFLKTITTILADYADAVPIEMFTTNTRLNLEYYRARIAGRRLVVASETEQGATWTESQLKEMSGNEAPLSARHPYGQPFTYQPQFKIGLVGNHAPKLKSRSVAMERRLRIIPFTHKPKTVDPNLKDKLRAEHPAILRWMIDGCLMWQRDRLGTAAAVTAATDKYFESQDSFRRWLDERCILGDTLSTKPGALLADFNAWAKENGESQADNNSFAELIDRTPNLTRKKANGVRMVRGIGLRPSDTDQRSGDYYT